MTQTETPVAWVASDTLDAIRRQDGGYIWMDRAGDTEGYTLPLYDADALTSAYRRGIEDAAEVADEAYDFRESTRFPLNELERAQRIAAKDIAAAIRAKGA